MIILLGIVTAALWLFCGFAALMMDRLHWHYRCAFRGWTVDAGAGTLPPLPIAPVLFGPFTLLAVMVVARMQPLVSVPYHHEGIERMVARLEDEKGGQT